MFRLQFQEFEEKNETKNPEGSAYEDDNSYTLDDSMFRCFIHWYTSTTFQDISDQRIKLIDLAQQYNVVLCVARILTQSGEKLNMIDLKAIGDMTKLPQFLSQAIEVSKITLIKKKFKVLSICMINKFGMFKALTCRSLCKDCGDEERLNECCAHFVCGKCHKNILQEGCWHCNKKLDVQPIPLQTAAKYQSQYIYQPIFPYLPLDQRIELMQMIEEQLD